MSPSTKKLLERVAFWPEEDVAELEEVAREIEARRSGVYHATPDELKAIDDADRSGVAIEADVEAACCLQLQDQAVCCRTVLQCDPIDAQSRP